MRWVFGAVLFFFLLCCCCSRSVDLLVFALSIPPLLSRNVSPQHPMVFSFSLGIRRAIEEALVRRFACLRAEIGSDGEGKEGVCNSSVRGLFVWEKEDFLASGGEQRGFLLLQQGRKASQWRDCDDFTRRLFL